MEPADFKTALRKGKRVKQGGKLPKLADPTSLYGNQAYMSAGRAAGGCCTVLWAGTASPRGQIWGYSDPSLSLRSSSAVVMEQLKSPRESSIPSHNSPRAAVHALECAESYLRYGAALFQKAQGESDVFGAPLQTAVAAQEGPEGKPTGACSPCCWRSKPRSRMASANSTDINSRSKEDMFWN